MASKPMLPTEVTAAQRERLRRELEPLGDRVLEACPVDRYVAALDAYPSRVPLGFVGPEVRRCCELVRSLAGEDGLELYHQVLLLALIDRARPAVAAVDLPEDIKALYEHNFQRITRMIAGRAQAPGHYLHPRFSKDLGLCTLRLIPAGVQVVHLYRLPRRLFVAGGPRQALAWAVFVARMRGLQPFYEMHMHSDDLHSLQEFTPAGWARLYRRLAELLRRNPRVKGVIGGGSWLFDPALARVSPELAYVRTIVTDNGGRLFPTGPCNADGIRDATLYSPHRRRLYEEGSYTPMGHLVVWPRRSLIGWADRVAAAASPAPAAPPAGRERT